MISGIYTHPHDMGNRQRIYRECLQMKELGWQIDFLFYGSKLGGNIDEMRDFFGKDRFFYANPTSISPVYQLKGIMRGLFDKNGMSKYIPLFFNRDEFYYREVKEKIQLLLRKKQYDVVWLQYAFESKVLEGMEDRVFTVIDTHDIYAYRNLMYQREGRIPEGFYMTRRQERESLSRADLVVAIQNEEEKYFKNLMRRHTTECITLGDLVGFHKSKSGDEKVFGFIGAENDANVLGIEWLAREVLPIVQKMEPKSKCIIAGGICKLVGDSKYYTKIGKVKTLQEYYDQISFALNPIQNGTGLNIKGIEALSYGKPLISTVVGAKGLSDAEDAMLVCNNARQFAEQIVLLLNDEEKRLFMSREAEKFILRYNEANRNVLLEIEHIVAQRSKG